MTDRPAAPAAEAGERAPRWGAAALLLAMLGATTLLSQFFRASTSVIGPELIRDLSLSSEALGFANGSYFLAVLLAQIPVGVALDRAGPRLTVGTLSLLMVVGALMHGVVESGAGLAAARFVVGVGCAGSFMSAVVLVSRWFPRHLWSMALSWVFALSQIGLFLAGLPLAYLSETIGWRAAFTLMAIFAAVAGLAFLFFVRDEPPGAPAAATQSAAADPLGAIAGLRSVLAAPGLLRVLALFLVGYGSTATVFVLWAGPYLNDVHGLDPIARGQVLLAMAAVQLVGALAIGPMDRLFNTRKWVVVGCASVCVGTLAALALAPMVFAPAFALLLVMSVASTYTPVMLAHIRSHFPDSLAGRGATTGNMAQLVGAAMLPILTGLIPPLFPAAGPGYSLLAYRWIFATLAVALAAGLAVYLTARDAKPAAGK